MSLFDFRRGWPAWFLISRIGSKYPGHEWREARIHVGSFVATVQVGCDAVARCARCPVQTDRTLCHFCTRTAQLAEALLAKPCLRCRRERPLDTFAGLHVVRQRDREYQRRRRAA